jgi:RHS repeat-associated protein
VIVGTTGYTIESPVVKFTVKAQPQLNFIEVDHLNTPRLVADANGVAVWKWDQQEPFGDTLPDQNPSGLGTFDFGPRLPGQFADTETNTVYNYNRDYDPELGRYIESDPLRVLHSAKPRRISNLYLYVDGAPLRLVDPFGLQSRICKGDICVEEAETFAENLRRNANSPLHHCRNNCLLHFALGEAGNETVLHQLHRFGELAGRFSLVLTAATLAYGGHELETCIAECQDLRCVAPGTYP